MGLMDKMKDTVKSADEKIGNVIDKEKLDSQIRDQKREIEKLTAEIGEKIVSALREGKEAVKEEIEEIYSKIKECEAKIADLEAKKKELS